MKKAHSTRIANIAAKSYAEDQTSSLGFWRLNFIPRYYRSPFTMAFAAKSGLCVAKDGVKVQDLIVAKFEGMSLAEFKAFLLRLEKIGE